MKTIDPELFDELAALAGAAGCELLATEFKGGVLRLILDRPGGVSLADCETVSRQASALLDVVDFGDGHYTLEVSSPGLDRELYGARDYERFVGQPVRVTWREPAGRKRTVVGRLAAWRPEAGGILEVEEADRGLRLEIPVAGLVRARLEPQL